MSLDHDPPIVVLPERQAWDEDASDARAQWLVRLAPMPGDIIAELACGEGERAIAIKQAEPRAVVYALDPDVDALNRGEIAARDAGATVHFLWSALADAAAVLAPRRIAKLVVTEARIPRRDAHALAAIMGIPLARVIWI